MCLNFITKREKNCQWAGNVMCFNLVLIEVHFACINKLMLMAYIRETLHLLRWPQYVCSGPVSRHLREVYKVLPSQ